MSAVLGTSATGAASRREGVWAAAWGRFRGDRVGVASLGVVAAFVLLMLAAALGLVAGDWQRERGVPNAPPGFLGTLNQTLGKQLRGHIVLEVNKDLSALPPREIHAHIAGQLPA